MKGKTSRIQWYIPEPARHHDSDNAQQLVYIAQEMGDEVFCQPYRPFGKMDYSFLDHSKPVVLYGHLAVVKDVQRRRIPLSPFAWCDFDELKCSNYYAFWGGHSVQERYAIFPLAEIVRQRDFIYDTFGLDNCIFIRPDDNMKTFTGEVVHRASFDGWARSAIDYAAGPNCPCVVSRPEIVEREWRFVIADDKVVTGSQYKTGPFLDVAAGFPDAAAAKAEEIANSAEWQPHTIYVMDIGAVGRKYKLMEVGSVNVAGLYACDLRAFAKAVREQASC